MISQRDAFFNKLFQRAREDRDIILVSADMGAPSLDQWRETLPSQYINVGIAEANAIGIATGLAKLGKKVYVYAIAPFITLRCYEQIKLGPCTHNLPITIVGVGAGFSYEDSGPTHHTLEDVSIMSTLPHMCVVTITDSVMASHFANSRPSGPVYLRLDRSVTEPIYTRDLDFSFGYGIIQADPDYRTVVFTQGDLVHSFIGAKCTLIDLFSIPWKPELGRTLKKIHPHMYRDQPCRIILAEENLQSPLYEHITKELGFPPTMHIRVDKKYTYEYGGRENIRKQYGLDMTTLRSLVV